MDGWQAQYCVLYVGYTYIDLGGVVGEKVGCGIWSRGTCGGWVVLTRARARRPTQSWDLGVKGWERR